MNKKDLVTRVSDLLRENDIRKPVSIKKNTFKITDSDGKTADFTVKQQDKFVLYTAEDVGNVLDACLFAIEEALKTGEKINLRGFGTLGLHYRAARRVREPNEEIWHTIDGHFLPKFMPGKDLRMAAKIFELQKKDLDDAPKLPDPVYDEYD